jgi:Icc-related predicted phosphoesterase
MQIVAISDTHSHHNEFEPIPGDVVVFCGDATGRDSIRELPGFLQWFEDYPAEHKIMIPGNHDWDFDKVQPEILAEHGITMLFDTSIVIDGIKFYGTAWQPYFCDWAYNLRASWQLTKAYELIPDDTDVLITHCPPFGIQDKAADGDYCGSKELLKRVRVVKPKLHLFGHIHEGYGIDNRDPNTIFANASILDDTYRVTNAPIPIEL